MTPPTPARMSKIMHARMSKSVIADLALGDFYVFSVDILKILCLELSDLLALKKRIGMSLFDNALGAFHPDPLIINIVGRGSSNLLGWQRRRCWHAGRRQGCLLQSGHRRNGCHWRGLRWLR